MMGGKESGENGREEENVIELVIVGELVSLLRNIGGTSNLKH